MQCARDRRGVTLIEVLVALLIFSIGLMGVAGLLVMSGRSIHAAYLRTQVTFLAQSMADRMGANSIGVWSGDYNGVYPQTQIQHCEVGCTPRLLAADDKAQWSSQLATFLPPGVKASIQCDQAGVAYKPTSAQLAMRPSYGGSCAMSITWAERSVGNEGADVDAPALQTFAWTFQP